MNNLFRWLYVDFDNTNLIQSGFGSSKFRSFFRDNANFFIEEHYSLGVSMALTTPINGIDAVICYGEYIWFLSEMHKVLRNLLILEIEKFEWETSELTKFAVETHNEKVSLLADKDYSSEFSSFYDYQDSKSIQTLEQISKNELVFPANIFCANLYYVYKWFFMFSNGMDQHLDSMNNEVWNDRFFKINTISLYTFEQALKSKNIWFDWMDEVPEWFMDSRKWTDYDGPPLKVRTYPDWDKYVISS